MSPASCIRTLFSLVVKNISCEWKCCITTNADEGESVDGIKYTLVLFFVEYGAVAKKTLRINALLKSIYTDLRHPASFSSPYTLFRAAKQKNPNILYKDVESWLESQPVYTKYRRIKVKYPRRKVLSRD